MDELYKKRRRRAIKDCKNRIEERIARIHRKIHRLKYRDDDSDYDSDENKEKCEKLEKRLRLSEKSLKNINNIPSEGMIDAIYADIENSYRCRATTKDFDRCPVRVWIPERRPCEVLCMIHKEKDYMEDYDKDSDDPDSTDMSDDSDGESVGDAVERIKAEEEARIDHIFKKRKIGK